MAYYSEHRTNPAQKNPLSIGSPMQIDRRRATHHLFGGTAEVIDVESQRQLISLTRDLSLYGCFIAAKAPFPKGARVSLKIANSKATFSAVGNVIHNLSDEGMGIAFVQVEAKDQAVLEEWLAEAGANGIVTGILEHFKFKCIHIQKRRNSLRIRLRRWCRALRRSHSIGLRQIVWRPCGGAL